MEAMAGKSRNSSSRAKGKLGRYTSQCVRNYGVVGKNKDTRDWSIIMSSEDILTTARAETGKMYNPMVDVRSHLKRDGTLISQTAVLKDMNGNILRALPNRPKAAEDTLKILVRQVSQYRIAWKTTLILKNLQRFVERFNKLSTYSSKFETRNYTIRIQCHIKKNIEEIPFHEYHKL